MAVKTRAPVARSRRSATAPASATKMSRCEAVPACQARSADLDDRAHIGAASMRSLISAVGQSPRHLALRLRTTQKVKIPWEVNAFSYQMAPLQQIQQPCLSLWRAYEIDRARRRCARPPSTQQHFEAGGSLRSIDDFDGPLSKFCQRIAELVASIKHVVDHHKPATTRSVVEITSSRTENTSALTPLKTG